MQNTFSWSVKIFSI